MLGFVGANAYLAYKAEGGTEGISEFFEGLAMEMLTNKMDGCVLDTRVNLRNASERHTPYFVTVTVTVGGCAPRAKSFKAELAQHGNHVLRHMIRPLTVLKQYENNSGAKLTCRICGQKSARYFCVSCSNVEQKFLVPLCGVKGDKDCQA
jgi:hypothetical protein